MKSVKLVSVLERLTQKRSARKGESPHAPHVLILALTIPLGVCVSDED